MQNIYIFIDDSGVLHGNDKSGHFVYAGLAFIGKERKERAVREYMLAEKKLRDSGAPDGEIKSYGSNGETRRYLYNIFKKQESLSVDVEIKRVFEQILSNTKSICRYKDYVLKRAIKAKLQAMVKRETVSPDENTNLIIFVDEQLTASNGFYGLSDTIKEELRNGIINYNYNTIHPPVFNGRLTVSVTYCESCKNALIRASDILANRVWSSFVLDKPEWRKIPKHTHLTLP